MIEPFHGDTILQVKSEEDHLVVIGGEANCVELDNAVDFAKEGSDLFVFTGEHPRILDFDRRAEFGCSGRRLTQNLHDALLKSDLIVGQDVEHASEVGYVLRLSRIRKASLSLRELSLRCRLLRSCRRAGRVVVLNRIRSSTVANVHRKLRKVFQWKRHLVRARRNTTFDRR